MPAWWGALELSLLQLDVLLWRPGAISLISISCWLLFRACLAAGTGLGAAGAGCAFRPNTELHVHAAAGLAAVVPSSSEDVLLIAVLIKLDACEQGGLRCSQRTR